MARNASARKIVNGVISLLRCHCNPNTPVVVIFPNLCLWPSSLCSNLGYIYPQKPHRTTLRDWVPTAELFGERSELDLALILVSLVAVFLFSFGKRSLLFRTVSYTLQKLTKGFFIAESDAPTARKKVAWQFLYTAISMSWSAAYFG